MNNGEARSSNHWLRRHSGIFPAEGALVSGKLIAPPSASKDRNHRLISLESRRNPVVTPS